jgi:Flp pilus assembly pilin Flp
MKRLISRLWNEEKGQDLTEYALLLALVALATVASIGNLAAAIQGVFAGATSNLT